MAIIGQLTLDQITILEVDLDPTTSGVSAPIGSLAAIYDGASAKIWIKTAAGDTAWTAMVRLADGATALSANQPVMTNASGYLQNIAQFKWDGAGRFGLGSNAPTTPQSTIHLDRGNAQGTHIRMTAGTTTGQAAGDGTEFGIDTAGNAEILQYENSNINFYTNNTLRGAFANTGQFLIGTSTPIDITGASAFPTLQFVGTSAVQMVGIQYSADTIGPVFNQLKSRGVTVGAQGLVLQDDEFGRFQFRGSDGVNFQAGASIRGLVDGTAAAGSMPGRLIFMTTPTGSTTPVERMRISQNGLVRVVDNFQRRRIVADFDTITTANTTTTLTSSSAALQLISGTTAGQIVRLPDATTLVVGAQYELRSSASVTVAIQDNAGGALDTIPTTTGTTVAILTANGTAAGTWYVRTRFEPFAQEVNSTAGFNLTSTTDVLVTGMTITPAAGTYIVTFSSTINMATAAATYGCRIYVGGTQQANTDRPYQCGQNSFGTFTPGTLGIATDGTVTVNGSQAIEIRARRSAGTTTIGNRTMRIVKVS